MALTKEVWLGIVIIVSIPIIGAILYFGGVITNLLSFVDDVLVIVFGAMFVSGVALIYKGWNPKSSNFQRGMLPLPISKNVENSLSDKILEYTDEKATKKSVLLPDNNEITKLNVTNSFLDEIYKKARSEATKINNDAKLSSFSISVFPFNEQLSSKVNIYMVFYSKWTNRTYQFKYDEDSQQIKHILPDKRSISYLERAVFAKVPWRKNPRWMQFLDRAYAKVKPLPASEYAGYALNANAAYKMPWKVDFNDERGNPHIYSWDGVGLDENSIIADVEK
jgi:hypothetical protein